MLLEIEATVFFQVRKLCIVVLNMSERRVSVLQLDERGKVYLTERERERESKIWKRVNEKNSKLQRCHELK